MQILKLSHVPLSPLKQEASITHWLFISFYKTHSKTAMEKKMQPLPGKAFFFFLGKCQAVWNNGNKEVLSDSRFVMISLIWRICLKFPPGLLCLLQFGFCSFHPKQRLSPQAKTLLRGRNVNWSCLFFCNPPRQRQTLLPPCCSLILH